MEDAENIHDTQPPGSPTATSPSGRFQQRRVWRLPGCLRRCNGRCLPARSRPLQSTLSLPQLDTPAHFFIGNQASLTSILEAAPDHSGEDQLSNDFLVSGIFRLFFDDRLQFFLGRHCGSPQFFRDVHDRVAGKRAPITSRLMGNHARIGQDRSGGRLFKSIKPAFIAWAKLHCAWPGSGAGAAPGSARLAAPAGPRGYPRNSAPISGSMRRTRSRYFFSSSSPRVRSGASRVTW